MIKRKKILTILSCVLISSLAFSFTQAYFNSKIDLKSMLSEETAKALEITNGAVSLSFGDKPSSWIVDDSEINAINDVVEVPSRKNNSITAKYEYVYLDNTKTNLTTKINLAVLYGLNSNVPSYTNEVTSKVNPTEPFEVIVGDMDNCNLTQKGEDKKYYQGFEQLISPFSGQKYDHSSSVDIYPYDNMEFAYNQYEPSKNAGTGLNKIDAAGTDRRMVASGFYNTIMEISGKTKSEEAYASIVPSKASYTVYNKTKYRLLKLTQNYDDGNNALYSGHQLWCDYYTDRPMRGFYGESSDYPTNTPADDCKIKGVNWRYIQPVEPLTFKYEQIPDDEDITSAQIYLYIDDIQSGLALETSSDEFSAVSQNKYSVILSVKEGETWKDYEVPEWASTVNEVVLDGPSGYSMTFNLPKRLLKIIKKASGLNNGLRFRIDDNNFGTTGDSYAIDFAKLTVNKKPNPLLATDGVSVSGTVKCGDTPLQGITITGADGRSTSTDSSGNYSFVTAPGVISITASSKTGEYSSQTKTFPYTIAMGRTQVWDFNLEKQSLSADNAEKFKVNLKLEEYIESTKSWQEIDLEEPKNEEGTEIDNFNSLVVNGTEVKYVSKIVQLHGNSKYRVSYEVIANSQNEIYSNASEDFYTQFWSKLIARSTQENNPGWDENGENIEDYVSNYYNPSSNSTSVSAKKYTGSITNSNAIPYDGATILIREKRTNKIEGSYQVEQSNSNFEITALLDSTKNYEFVTKSSIHEENVTDINDINITSGYNLSLRNEKKTKVYIDKPSSTSGNSIDFNNFNIYKENEITEKNYNGTSHYNSNYDIKNKASIDPSNPSGKTIGDNWYNWTLNDSNKSQIAIQIRNDTDQNNPWTYTFDTKPMYWFTTNKIFVCTQ